MNSLTFFLQVVFALNQTLSFQEKLRVGKAHVAYTTDDLIDHYNCGDLTSVLFSTQSTRLPSISSNFSLRQLELKRTQEIDQYFRKELIFKRNERMAKRVIELLNKYPERNFFFAFGAGECHYHHHNHYYDPYCYRHRFHQRFCHPYRYHYQY